LISESNLQPQKEDTPSTISRRHDLMKFKHQQQHPKQTIIITSNTTIKAHAKYGKIAEEKEKVDKKLCFLLVCLVVC